MKVEYTGRQTVVHDGLKAQAEEALTRIGKLLGRASTAHVILTEDKYRMIAEVTVATKGHSLVATCKAPEMTTALHDALAKVEQQAIRHKQKTMTQKRHPKNDKHEADVAAGEAELSATPVKRIATKKLAAKQAAAASSNGAHGKKSVARKSATMVVQSFPAGRNGHAPVEPHVVRSIDSAAMLPMTFEEAVKEAALRDRDVFVFRDHQEQVMILHRQRDGKMELIEVP